MSVSEHFTVAQVAVLTGLTEARIRDYAKRGVYRPSVGSSYSIEDLITLRAAERLMSDFGVKPGQIKKVLAWLGEERPGLELSALTFHRIGDAVFFRDGESELKISVSPAGQTVLDMSLEDVRQEIEGRLISLEDRRQVNIRRRSADHVDGWVNKLILGDNLDVLRSGPDSGWYIPSESVDLIYLDPPFNSKATYNQLFKEHSGEMSAAQIKAFEDTWRWSLEAEQTYRDVVLAGGRLAELLPALRTFLGTSDMMAYVIMMAPRLAELHRALKPTGSIYLHCDPTASHYLKMLMDAIWGPRLFRNEVIWQRTNSRSTRGRWPRVHDVLLYYSKSDRPQFKPTLVSGDMQKIPHTLITWRDGKKYQTYELTAPGKTEQGDSGRPWRGFDPSAMGRHWANDTNTRDQWDAQDLIHWPKNGGFPRRRDAEPFVPEARMVTVGDLWTDVDRINQAAKERLGYPTQKPEALLERIIQASSNPGDMVLDPFCGCGTSVAVAERLGRRWIGIDVSDLALYVMDRRLQDTFGDEVHLYDVVGDPTDPASARRRAEKDPYQFQWWVMRKLGATPREVKGADRGIDGVIHFFASTSDRADRCIVQVKGGHVSARDVRDLRGVIEREKAAIGVLVSAQPTTRDMRREAAEAGFFSVEGMTRDSYPRLQLLTVDELFAGYGIEYPRYGHIDGIKEAPRRRRPQGEQKRLAG